MEDNATLQNRHAHGWTTHEVKQLVELAKKHQGGGNRVMWKDAWDQDRDTMEQLTAKAGRLTSALWHKVAQLRSAGVLDELVNPPRKGRTRRKSQPRKYEPRRTVYPDGEAKQNHKPNQSYPVCCPYCSNDLRPIIAAMNLA